MSDVDSATREAQKKKMLERIAAKKKLAAEQGSSGGGGSGGDIGVRRVQSAAGAKSMLNSGPGARRSFSPGSSGSGRGSTMSQEEREAMVAKLKSQKRATVGSTASAMQRSKSAGVTPSGGNMTAEEKRQELKNRLASFNNSKGNLVEKEDDKRSRFTKSGTTGSLQVKHHDPLLDEDSDEDDDLLNRVSPRRSASSPRSTSPRSTSPRSSGTSPRSSSGRVVYNEVYKVGEKCEALYLEDGIWYAAKVKEVKANNTYLIVFTEYGNEQVCKTKEMKKRKKKRSEDKEARLAKIKKQQNELKNEAMDGKDEGGESGGRWRGQSSLSVPTPELTVNGDSKKSRTRAKAGTLSQMGNDDILGQTAPETDLFADDAPIVASSRQRSKAHSFIESDEEDQGDEVKSESPSFLTKLFGTNAEEEAAGASPQKGFFAKMFGSSSDEEQTTKPAAAPARKAAPPRTQSPRRTTQRTNGQKKDDGKSGFFDDLFSSSKGEEENDGSSDDEVLDFFGK